MIQEFQAFEKTQMISSQTKYQNESRLQYYMYIVRHFLHNIPNEFQLSSLKIPNSYSHIAPPPQKKNNEDALNSNDGHFWNQEVM